MFFHSRIVRSDDGLALIKTTTFMDVFFWFYEFHGLKGGTHDSLGFS